MITYACGHTEPVVTHRVYTTLKCDGCRATETPTPDYKAHAERLAEALREALTKLEMAEHYRRMEGDQLSANGYWHAANVAREALAQWEGAKDYKQRQNPGDKGWPN